ncbi:Replicative superfamily II helicase [Franzmannia pantelleriensis]|uniref:Replicative superfamily II helicase n=1 Tax=Franzmannia pantelleriensis TaxID=48727 RepID=A0A1G9ID34_9GAMM|nr:DEAD/DEAH box helicase [Halomonas pantelleriensis]SDL23032.1 Replicative superfamily II helicase [Halomonas pantelleriensis]
MRETLAKWVSDADALHHVERFGFSQLPLQLDYLRSRGDDYYISLVGELFERLHEPYRDSVDWSRLGNAITQAGGVGVDQALAYRGILSPEAAVFAAAAFYFGGYSASAYLTLKAADPNALGEIQRACHELLSRPSTIQSARVRALVGAVRGGDLEAIRSQIEHAAEMEASALQTNPDEWVGWRLFQRMLSRFAQTNIRAVLPDGEAEFWDPLVRSLLNRDPPTWDFFPSQIDAIRSGLLGGMASFSIQMPTGAGKTALSETLLFYHLNRHPQDVAILLVPFRSLAAELRGSLVKRLGRMGLPARCAYGGTVPTGGEVRDLDNTRALVATPEALSGLLSAEPGFFSRISLVICDEGHLLDGKARGVGLELLLARMRARESGPPKFVFVSAIVPNIEEINAWLGGTDATVVRSDYRPAHADFAALRVAGKNAKATVALQLHPHHHASTFSIERFLSRDDFRYRNASTGRLNTYSFNSVKAQAIAAARKALSMGAVAVFAANKRGNQGAVGLADELLSQLANPLPMPAPFQFVDDAAKLQAAVEYFTLEYGASWVGTRTLAAGAVLHHGDIPQESREVVEALVRKEDVRLAICTSTLAEGVNLPIRTLVLYSVQRRGPDGAAENLLARDIKNLVGRAGRAGATTKGLVICANPAQWPLVAPVAQQQPGERVSGALIELMGRLQAALNQRSITLTNDILEGATALHTLIDGIDATLIDLAAEELGEDELIRIAGELSSQTFAASQAQPETTALMKHVFELRARRVSAIKGAGRLGWIRETGTRVRMLESVEVKLLPMRESWDDIAVATDPELTETLLMWAWDLPEVTEVVKEAYRDASPSRSDFVRVLDAWIDGQPLVELARRAGIDIDTMLGVHARVISHVLQVVVEQAVGLLKKLLEENERELSQAVVDFPEHLRFGVPTLAARVLAAGGVRHRRAAVALGRSSELAAIGEDGRASVFPTARRLLDDEERWLPVMGRLVLENTREDLRESSDPDDGV